MSDGFCHPRGLMEVFLSEAPDLVPLRTVTCTTTCLKVGGSRSVAA